LFLDPIPSCFTLCFSVYLKFVFVSWPAEIRQRKLMDKYNELKVMHSGFMWLLIFYADGHLSPYAWIYVDHLQETGKLDAFIEKRRKKNASKDHRYMPYRRDGGGA
jgi:hypothetical protein